MEDEEASKASIDPEWDTIQSQKRESYRLSLKMFYAKAGFLNFQLMAAFTLDIFMSPWVYGYLSFFFPDAVRKP